MKHTLVKGTRLWHGNETLVLPADTEVDFENIPSVDALAEHLASNIPNFSLNLPGLAHSEEKVDGRGKTYTVLVTYGANGARVENNPKHVTAQAALQKKNVGAADKAVLAEAKKLDAAEAKQVQVEAASAKVQEAKADAQEAAAKKAAAKAEKGV